ncbi:hypothetical protein [Halomontanus rarus]|nr:hypothetical protein [Halovivax sp. TS33]
MAVATGDFGFSFDFGLDFESGIGGKREARSEERKVKNESEERK